MKTLVKLFALLCLVNLSAHADLHASRGSAGGGHVSGGAHAAPSVRGHAFFGHHFHGGPGVFFYGDFYPYYAYPDYYYPGYYTYGPSYSPSAMGQAYSPSGPSYEELGKFWGKNLKRGTATRDQFIAFLQSDLLKASDAARSLFEGGFLKTYGKDGPSLLNRALNDARAASPVTSSDETPPASKPGAVIQSPPTKVPPATPSKN